MLGIPVLAIAYALAAGANFLLSLCVGRALGAAALGELALAVAVARVFYAATDFGIASQITRTVARDRTHASSLASMFLGVRLALIPVAVLIAFVAALASSNNLSLFLLIALTHGLISVQALYEALFLSHERATAAGLLTITTSMLVAAGCAVWYRLHAGLPAFGALYLVATALGIVAWIGWERSALTLRLRPALRLAGIRSELRESWPIGASVLLGIAALRAPILALGAFRSDADVGAFSAVDMLVTASGILQTAVSNATYPKLAKAFRTDRPAFRRLFWRSNASLAAIGAFVGICIVVLGPRFIPALFPAKDFTRVIPLLGVIGWSTPCLFLAHHNIFVFAAADQQHANVRVMGVWCAILATTQLLLVPTYGITGAAWGVLIGRTLGVGFLLFTLFASPIMGKRFGAAV